MPPFKSPTPAHTVNPGREKRALTAHFKKRGVPRSRKNHLLLTSWNIANLGAQKRKPAALEVIAHLMKRFDLIAVQEVNSRFDQFIKIVEKMGRRFSYVMTDTAGNQERLAYIYRKSKVKPRELFGELALRPREYPKRTVRVRYKKGKTEKVEVFKKFRFTPFDRNPFIGSFRSGNIDFTVVNVHLYFGSFQDSKTKEERQKYARRVLEIFALAKWADRRVDDPKATFDRDIVLLGDMNVPVMDKKDAAYKALVSFGFQPVKYLEEGKTGGSNIVNTKTYDQVAFAPGSIGRRVTNLGVFDFDNAVFKDLWSKLTETRSEKKATGLFNRHVKHHLSDHRPIWVEIRTN
ncbi:MAG: endonuclease/exonuclease/phosphatase family protein [Planctomycetota bacterium]|jgi:endonuclease/exonuclease/phosphatase family metal-dependent hydrolase